jgi:predicted LPLAT superfamily acyltransferase
MNEPERGSDRWLRVMLWITVSLSAGIGQLLLYPITLYFYATSPSARAASADYLRRVFGRPAHTFDVLRHFHTFACVILDRVFFLSGRTAGFRTDISGLDAVTRVLNSGQGCVLLGSHLGSFDVLRTLGRKAPVRVNPVMFRLNSGPLTRMLESLDPELARDVIEMGKPDAMMRVQECLARGEMVSFLADRVYDHDGRRRTRIEFLGAPADFPTGPLALAAILQVPVVLFFGLRLGWRHYAIQFEPLTERIAGRRDQRETEIRACVEQYGASLSAHCRAAPFNWFNFYPFWDGSQR